jgi:hypothetical protein
VIMPHYGYVPHPEGTTSEEFQALLKLRREALEAYARDDASLLPTPVAWRVGWKAHIRLQGRDRDGCLKAHIVVEGPRGETPYVRAVRLIARQPLPWTLAKE